MRHPGRRTGWAAPLGAAVCAAVFLVGCEGTHYTPFRPVGRFRPAGGGWVAARVIRLPPGEEVVEIALAARGQTHTNPKGVEFDALHLRVTIHNRGEEALTLVPAEARLTDDEGRTVSGAEAYAGRNRTASLTVAGGARAEYELVFDLPEGSRLEDLGSVRLRWPWRYGKARGEMTAKFIRVEEINYYYPPPCYDPWWDPWYDPWYRPWPRSRFGIGYWHGW